jgi:hypothetical protein
MLLRFISVVAAVLFAAFSVLAAPAQDKKIESFKDEASLWNQFAKMTHDLHKQQINGRKIRKTGVTERYNGQAAHGYAYTETNYHDAQSGLLLSRVRVDRDHPENLNLVEVFIYDEQGRVIRDFSAIYLPWARNAPINTMINFHRYNGNLHAYRQFDASGVRIYEQCKGKHGDEKIDISLEQQDIPPYAKASRAYQACFAGVQATAGDYLVPH